MRSKKLKPALSRQPYSFSPYLIATVEHVGSTISDRVVIFTIVQVRVEVRNCSFHLVSSLVLNCLQDFLDHLPATVAICSQRSRSRMMNTCVYILLFTVHVWLKPYIYVYKRMNRLLLKFCWRKHLVFKLKTFAEMFSRNISDRKMF